jgi:cold shock CspA family protein
MVQGPPFSGVVLRNNGKFAFIKQDNGEADMFVMPNGCSGYGGQIPMEGEQVGFHVVIDEKSGRPRAEGVVPVGMRYTPPSYGGYGPAQYGGKGGKSGPYHQQANHSYEAVRPTQMPRQKRSNSEAAQETLFAYAWGQHLRKPLQTELDEVRVEMSVSEEDWHHRLIITNRHGELLLMPVEFDLIQDQFPLEVKLKAELPPVDYEANHFGEISSVSAKFGFIKQENGGEDMFVMPSACQAWGGKVPDVGTRVQFKVTVDERTRRTRATDVEPA